MHEERSLADAYRNLLVPSRSFPKMPSMSTRTRRNASSRLRQRVASSPTLFNIMVRGREDKKEEKGEKEREEGNVPPRKPKAPFACSL